MNGKRLIASTSPLGHIAQAAMVCIVALCSATPALAQTGPTLPPRGCHDGQLGAQLIQICFPRGWNGTLIVFAHGYTPVQVPLALPTDELTVDGVYVPNLLMAQGFAFATSSFSRNGYAVQAADGDLNTLVDYFASLVPSGSLQKVYMTGASEGGLITTMMVEKYPSRYVGGLAMCGPIGGTPYQGKAQGDFNVVFNYFFPSVFGFGVVNVPPDAWQNWSSYETAITNALNADPSARDQLFNVTKVARDPADPAGTSDDSAIATLWYNIWATNDLIATAGGNPYDNRLTRYSGSLNDIALNRGVERVAGVPSAVNYLRTWYQPTGQLQRPLVTLHTLYDPVVPYSHELIYAARVVASGHGANLTVIPVQAYGHCAFTLNQVLGAFGVLMQRTGAAVPAAWAADMKSLPAQSAEQVQAGK